MLHRGDRQPGKLAGDGVLLHRDLRRCRTAPFHRSGPADPARSSPQQRLRSAPGTRAAWIRAVAPGPPGAELHLHVSTGGLARWGPDLTGTPLPRWLGHTWP